jgi:SAM-dependent methyltransferase
MKKLLHVGCNILTKDGTIPYFSGSEWQEIRYDIDPSVNPTIIGSMTDLGMIDAGSIDAIYSAHNIEHLYEFEAKTALLEFYRVLKDGGFLVLACPDLESVCQIVIDKGLYGIAYKTREGVGITPHDMIYGWGRVIETGNLFFAHKCGFDTASMHQKLGNARFMDFATFVAKTDFTLWAVARKGPSDESSIEEFARTVLIGVM